MKFIHDNKCEIIPWNHLGIVIMYNFIKFSEQTWTNDMFFVYNNALDIFTMWIINKFSRNL